LPALKPPELPMLSDPVEVHADWIEWRALASRASYASWCEYKSDIERAGTFDAVEAEPVDTHRGGPSQEEEVERHLDDVIIELTGRLKACDSAYPFDVNQQGIGYSPDMPASSYRFQLLLSLFGKDAGPSGTHPERAFERLSSEAACAYLGGLDRFARAEVFGSPRPVLPASFSDAVNELCQLLGEGGGYNPRQGVLSAHSHTSTHKHAVAIKDAHLDVVAWRPFADRKKGQLIVFGQCSTGSSWWEEGKLFELPDVVKWCEQFMLDPPLVSPMRAFFVPHCIERNRWDEVGRFGGILFERCRIASLVTSPSKGLQATMKTWADNVQSRWSD